MKQNESVGRFALAEEEIAPGIFERLEVGGELAESFVAPEFA